MAFSSHKLKELFIGRVPSLHHEHSAYKWWVLINVMIGTFMAVLDATIVNVALPKLMASFGVDVDKAEWVITVYMLAFAVMLPTSGWVADHLGYKKTYFMALFLFTFGSFLCGLAWNEDVLIGFRIVQAMGAGFLMPVGMAIVIREFPPRQRGIALGFWAIAAAASVSLGPLIGGYLVDNISWNAIFDVNIPVGIVGLLATVVIQREYKTEHSRSFDVVGFISMSVFLVALLLALSDGNAAWNTGGWTSPFILTCFAVAAVCFTIFLTVELTIEHPLIELSLFKNFNFAVTNGILFIFGLGMFGSTFLLPLYLQNSMGYTALQTGAMFLPVGILQAIFSPIAGYLSDKVNPKIPAIIGITLLGISLYLNGWLSVYSEELQLIVPLYLRGIAMGLLFTPLTTLAQSEIPRHKIAQSSGLFNVIRQLGGSFGVAIMGALLTRRMLYHTAMYGQMLDPHSPGAQAIASRLTSFSYSVLGSSQGMSAMQAKALLLSHAMKQAFVRAISDDFLVAAAITIVGVFPILFLRTHKASSHDAPAPME
jgi:DHA2 family multidrug resistance protein